MKQKITKWALIAPRMSREISDYLCGILDCIKTRPDIFLESYTFFDRDLTKLTETDGIISCLKPPADIRKLFAEARMKIPPTVIITNSNISDREFAYARFDNEKMTALLADKLISLKCASYAFCSSDLPYYDDASARMFMAYRTAIRTKTGKSPYLFRPRTSYSMNTSVEEIERFHEWIRTIPRPCGMLVHTDSCAHKMLDTCRLKGIRVPEELRIIGTGNSSVLCERTYPSLTSYESHKMKIGFSAAKALLAMTEGGKSPEEVSFIIPTGNIIERGSTMDAKGSGRISEAARLYIHEQIDGGRSPTIKEIAFHLSISRTKLNTDFLRTTGHTIHDEVTEYRLNRLAKSLKSSNTPISTLATKAGFATFSQATRAFKRRFGTTMSEYRQS